jgi:hypothetical protein
VHSICKILCQNIIHHYWGLWRSLTFSPEASASPFPDFSTMAGLFTYFSHTSAQILPPLRNRLPCPWSLISNKAPHCDSVEEGAVFSIQGAGAIDHLHGEMILVPYLPLCTKVNLSCIIDLNVIGKIASGKKWECIWNLEVGNDILNRI